MRAMPTNCPHKNPPTCRLCLECIPCRNEQKVREKQQSWLEWCKRERHTFMNLSAPCNSCRELIKNCKDPYPLSNCCDICWKPRSKMSELDRVLTSGPVYSSSSNSDDDYYPDYEGEDLEDEDDA
jgi:hypothetical protein